MVDPKELEVEIARLEYADSSYPNYAKLADLYIIQDRQNRGREGTRDIPMYSSTSAPEIAEQYGDSEFLTEIDGKDLYGVFGVLDDLMDTLRVVNPRAYNGVMRKLRAL